jgi:hypothetical protein
MVSTDMVNIQIFVIDSKFVCKFLLLVKLKPGWLMKFCMKNLRWQELLLQKLCKKTFCKNRIKAKLQEARFLFCVS